tara:strand:+ start:126 stop:497 length:372 start_codon:yes stop_codon:yes gene_type:complete
MDEIINCRDVYIKRAGRKGLGVFARKDFKLGEVVEKGIMMPLNNCSGHDNPHLFTWSEDKKVWAAGSGYLPFYNHSENPNIFKIGDLPNNILTFYASRYIRKDEEITGTYMSKKWRDCFKNQF